MGRTATHTTSLGKSSTPSVSPSTNMAVDMAVSAPPAKSGCQRTLSMKQQAIGIFFFWLSLLLYPEVSLATQQAQKEDVTKKRAFTEAVRAEQRREEGRGFQRPQSMCQLCYQMSFYLFSSGEERSGSEDLEYESEDGGDHSNTNKTVSFLIIESISMYSCCLSSLPVYQSCLPQKRERYFKNFKQFIF